MEFNTFCDGCISLLFAKTYYLGVMDTPSALLVMKVLLMSVAMERAVAL